MALGRTLGGHQHVVQLSRLGEPVEHLCWLLVLVILTTGRVSSLVNVRRLGQRHPVTQPLTAVGSDQTNLAILELLLHPDVVLDLVQLVSSRRKGH